MSAANKIVITLVGRTGDGKSTLANEILKRLGNETSPFEEGHTAMAHTREPQDVAVRDTLVCDNPGLMDTDGDTQDAANIKSIVIKARALGHLNMLVLVMNAKAVRFDAGMQSAVKVIADSFGVASLGRLFVVYTNGFGTSPDQLVGRTGNIVQMVNKRCNSNLTHLTHFVVENHPESFRPFVTDSIIASIHEQSYSQLDDLLTAAHAQEAYSTEYAIVGEPEHIRQVREATDAAERMAAEKAKAEREKDAQIQRADAAVREGQMYRDLADKAEKEKNEAVARVARAERESHMMWTADSDDSEDSGDSKQNRGKRNQRVDEDEDDEDDIPQGSVAKSKKGKADTSKKGNGGKNMVKRGGSGASLRRTTHTTRTASASAAAPTVMVERRPTVPLPAQGRFRVGDTVGIVRGALNGGLSDNRGVNMAGFACGVAKYRIRDIATHYGVQEALLSDVNSWIRFDSLFK